MPKRVVSGPMMWNTDQAPIIQKISNLLVTKELTCALIGFSTNISNILNLFSNVKRKNLSLIEYISFTTQTDKSAFTE